MPFDFNVFLLYLGSTAFLSDWPVTQHFSAARWFASSLNPLNGYVANGESFVDFISLFRAALSQIGRRDLYIFQRQNMQMHTHLAHPPHPDDQNRSPTSPARLLDAVSDTLLNAFARVRKPDDRFVDMRDSGDRFIEALTIQERLWARSRSRTVGKVYTPLPHAQRIFGRFIDDLICFTYRLNWADCSILADMAADYHDLAVAVQGLGFLESGITEPLNHFSNTLLEFSATLKHNVSTFTTAIPSVARYRYLFAVPDLFVNTHLLILP